MLYIGLCAIQMLIMAAGLVLAHRVENIYTKQISYSAELNTRQRAVSELRVLADSASPPSVDIVADDWDGEWSRIQYSSELFVRSARQLQQQIEPSGAVLSNGQQYLQSATEEMPQVVEQIRQAGDALRVKNTTLFRTHLFYADRVLARLYTAIGNLNEVIYRAKDTALDRDSALARQYRDFIGLLSVLGLLLVLPATAYARRLSKEVRAYELRLQVERDALERRVVERTAELRGEIDERRKLEEFEGGRNRLLELVAKGASVQEVLSELAVVTEAFCTDSRVLLMTGENDLDAPIAPSLSRQFLAALKPVLADVASPSQIAETEMRAVLITDIGRELAITYPPELYAQKDMVSWWVAPLLGSDHKAIGTISMFTSERRQPGKQELDVLLSAARIAALAVDHARMQEELFHRAHHDSLTQLPNRRLCDDRITEAIARACRHDGKAGLLCIDLDEFKQVNDTHGHDVGDYVLRTISARLLARLRATDTLSRVGGDEFLAVLDDIRNAEDLEKVAEALRNGVAEPIVFGNIVLKVTASIGAALYPTDGTTTTMLKLHADHAMYRAKERGRNTFQMFSAELSEKMANRRRLEGYLHDALDHNGFAIYYQPQYTLLREMIGLEALLRFRTPELTSISPAEFIPVAEQTGLILQIGSWVVREVCRQGKEWRDCGFSPVRISVNVSALELTEDKFAEHVEEALRTSGFEAKYLQIEVTETAVMSNIDEATRQLRELERLGVAVSVDDFGTGHSSLSYLHRLPIDTLKVDRSFVWRITQSEETEAIVRAIVAMANSLGLQVIAEGVETEDQLSAVAKVGCQMIQGYLFSRPLNSEAISAMLIERQTLTQQIERSSSARLGPMSHCVKSLSAAVCG
ncbi:MAG: EAL domain-containing protein [Candidatus Korobacteraceae bacterium]